MPSTTVASAPEVETEADMQQQLAGLHLETPGSHGTDGLAHHPGHQVHRMNAMMQQKPGVIRIADEVARGSHVLADQAGAQTEIGGRQNVAGNPVGGRIPLHEADDAGPPGPHREVGQILCLARRRGGRFFHEYGQTAFHRRRPDPRMHVRPDREPDRVEPRMGEHRVGISVAGADAVAVAHQRQPLLAPIGDRGDRDTQTRQLRQQHLGRVIAAPDPADPHHEWAAACSRARR